MSDNPFVLRFRKYFDMFDPRWDKLEKLYSEGEGTVKLFLPRFQTFQRGAELVEGISGAFNTLRERSIKKTVYYLVNYNLDRAEVEYVYRFCSPRKGNPIRPRDTDLDDCDYVDYRDLPKDLMKILKGQLDRSLTVGRRDFENGRVILGVEKYQNENELHLSISGGRR